MNNYIQGKNTKLKSNTNQTNNNSIFNKTFSNVNSSNNYNNTIFPYMKINILYVIIGILVLITSYMLFRYFRAYYVDSKIDFIQNKLSGNKNARDTMVIPYDLTPISMYGNEYNISFWMLINDLSYGLGKRKIILTKGNLVIYIDEKKNDLHIELNTYKNSDINNKDKDNDNEDNEMVTNTTMVAENNNLENDEANIETFISPINNNDLVIHKESKKETELIEKNNYLDPLIKHNELLDIVANDNYDNLYNIYNTNKEHFNSELAVSECSIYNIPIQRWSHYSINIVDNMVEVYIDGKLDTSCNLDVINKINTSSLIINPNGGFSGNLSNIYYSNIRLSTRQVQKIYNMGP